jgi:Ca-activated chloride channel family protein
MSGRLRGNAVGRGRGLALAVWFVSIVTILCDGPAIRAQGPGVRFRAGVDVVLLNVTVTDGSKRYVTDLDVGDFTVLEDGRPQNITFFRKADVRMALALLIDSSASMEESLSTAQEAAIGFVRELGPADLASVIDFDSRVQVLAPFTADRTALDAAIRSTVAGGSTAVYNAVYIALRELAKVRLTDEQEGLRRRAIVVLSDGEDTSSLVSFDEMLDLAQRSDSVIYTIGLGVDTPTVRRSADPSFVLTRLAQQTGGRAFFPEQAKQLTGVYTDIRNELSSQYLLAYVSSNERTTRWRGVNVRVNRPGMVVRTRQGYLAGS